MGKASVIIYITVAVLLLLLISKSPKNPNQQRHRHRRLKLRSNFTFNPKLTLNQHEHHIPFDPLVAEIERKREDREWEKMYFENQHPEWTQSSDGHAMPAEPQPEWEDFMDAEDYLNDEERFNVTNRLVLLFPKLDVDPADGFISESELTRWNLEQSEREVLHRSQRELEIHDKNKDGFVSFAEYEPPTWVKHSGNDTYGYDMGWWKEEHFNASDADGDGLLNITEFNDFLHPGDTKNPKLLNWLCKEEIRERDTDRDGKLSFKEFFHGLFDLVRNYDEENHGSENHSDDSEEAPARKLFDQLDKDGDRFLSNEELLPIIGKLHPSEHYYAKQQAEYIIQQRFATEKERKDRMKTNEYLTQTVGADNDSKRMPWPKLPDSANWRGFYTQGGSPYLCRLIRIPSDCVQSIADSDKDGRLTLSEMIDNPYVFYSAIFNDDEDDDFEFHDEFR